MERQLLRFLIAGIVISVALQAGSPAHADERALPSGTRIRLPDGVEVQLVDSHFLVERASLDRANAAAEMNRHLRASLAECVSSQDLDKSRPTARARWLTALKWLGVGLAVGGAFALGASV